MCRWENEDSEKKEKINVSYLTKQSKKTFLYTNGGSII